jgi:hypothetical protein
MTNLDDLKRFFKKQDTKTAAELRQVRKNLERLCNILEEREAKEAAETPCSLCNGTQKIDIGYAPMPCWRCTDAEGFD